MKIMFQEQLGDFIFFNFFFRIRKNLMCSLCGNAAFLQPVNVQLLGDLDSKVL